MLELNAQVGGDGGQHTGVGRCGLGLWSELEV